MTSLSTLTLGQFQEIWRIHKSDIDQEEKLTEMVAVLAGKTVNEVDQLTIPEFNSLAGQVKEILSQDFKTDKPHREILNYGICYEPAKLSRGQYVTLMHFMKGDVVENAHLILASITYNPKTKKHEADKHAEIAEHLQDAPVVHVLPVCFFFSKMFVDSMNSLKSYLVSEMMKKGASPRIALDYLTTLMGGLDGFITPREWQTLRDAALTSATKKTHLAS